MKKNILIIENQRFEFDTIFNFLSKYEVDSEREYDVFPKKDSFSKFMDYVQVIINIDYKEKYVKKAKDYLKNFIVEKSINIILMDYILAGQHCKTGIGLAEVINDTRKEEQEKEIPIVFFSKTELNNERKSKEEEKYKTKYELYEWRPKGYFGYEHLEKDYFKKKVIEEGIKVLLNLNEKKVASLPPAKY